MTIKKGNKICVQQYQILSDSDNKSLIKFVCEQFLSDLIHLQKKIN